MNRFSKKVQKMILRAVAEQKLCGGEVQVGALPCGTPNVIAYEDYSGSVVIVVYDSSTSYTVNEFIGGVLNRLYRRKMGAHGQVYQDCTE